MHERSPYPWSSLTMITTFGRSTRSPNPCLAARPARSALHRGRHRRPMIPIAHAASTSAPIRQKTPNSSLGRHSTMADARAELTGGSLQCDTRQECPLVDHWCSAGNWSPLARSAAARAVRARRPGARHPRPGCGGDGPDLPGGRTALAASRPPIGVLVTAGAQHVLALQLAIDAVAPAKPARRLAVQDFQRQQAAPLAGSEGRRPGELQNSRGKVGRLDQRIPRSPAASVRILNDQRDLHGGKPIQVRRLNDAVAGAAQGIRPMLIGEPGNSVWLRRHAHASSWSVAHQCGQTARVG